MMIRSIAICTVFVAALLFGFMTNTSLAQDSAAPEQQSDAKPPVEAVEPPPEVAEPTPQKPKEEPTEPEPIAKPEPVKPIQYCQGKYRWRGLSEMEIVTVRCPEVTSTCRCDVDKKIKERVNCGGRIKNASGKAELVDCNSIIIGR